MKLSIVLISCLFMTAGCVNIKAPDNLVSDSVNVGKDIYHSVKNEFSKDEDKVNKFNFAYEIPQNETLSVSTGKCIDEVIEKAKKALNKYSINVKRTESNLSENNGKSILNCTISI